MRRWKFSESKKHSRQFVIDFIKERTSPNEESQLPYLLRLRGPQNKEFYVQRDVMVPLFIKKSSEAGEDLRKTYMDLSVAAARANERCVPMADDERFSVDLKSRLQEGYHLLCALVGPASDSIPGRSTGARTTMRASGCFSTSVRANSEGLLHSKTFEHSGQ